MLLSYFLTSLKPIDLAATPPMSTEDFIRQSDECLTAEVTQDLERLLVIKRINHKIEADFLTQCLIDLALETSRDGLVDPLASRFLYWSWLRSTCHSSFIKRFADDASFLYQILAHLLAAHDGLDNHALTAVTTPPLWLSDTAQNFEIYQAALVHAPAYKILEHALLEPNPLALEDAVTEQLLAIVEHHVSDDAFSLDHVFAYFIKLILCERHASRNHDRGYSILAEILSNVCEGAHNERA